MWDGPGLLGAMPLLSLQFPEILIKEETGAAPNGRWAWVKSGGILSASEAMSEDSPAAH